jgi:hypothetical protein
VPNNTDPGVECGERPFVRDREIEHIDFGDVPMNR